MAYRVVADERGRAWEVWAVHPEWAERRAGRDRRRATPPATQWVGPERRSGTDRRLERQARAPLSPGMQGGWLVFESAFEKRRLGPVPPGWEAMDDAALVRLLAAAREVPKRRGRLVE